MTGEGGVDVMTKPVDFKMAPEAPSRKNFTPLPDFGKPDITQPPKYEEPSMTVPDMSDMPPELRKMMEDIKMDSAKEKRQTVLPPVKKEKPQGFWVQLKEKIKSFLKNWFG